ncbi:MAG TPA: lysylphosphatidylglycerol synthase domain-containing protein [Ginsengibacter sp.]|nr:lysylphosphatidylglycerol synthase domain-containing protein [Ginsengibacter sp.]
MIRARKNIKIIFRYVIAPLLGAWLFYSLYKQIKDQPNLQQSIDLIKQAPFGTQAWKFWFVIVLVFVNWGYEAKKWQVLLRTIQPVSFFTAYKSVLSGVTLSINTPNRIGEYGGRILYVQEGKRIKAISLSIAGSISQLIITLIMGCCGLIYIIYQANSDVLVMGLPVFWLKTLLFLSCCATVIVVLFYFRLSWLIKLVEKIPAAAKYVEYISVLDNFNAKLLLRLLYLSFFRYVVFVIQYILLLQVLDVSILWINACWIISILFLVLAIVPSFAIADLGIRGKFSTELLSLYSTNTVGIIGTTFGIWFINLFIPALAGSLLILSIKFFKDK